MKSFWWKERFVAMFALLPLVGVPFMAPTGAFAQSSVDVRLESSVPSLNPNASFDVDVRINSEVDKIGAYQFSISFDAASLQIDTSKNGGVSVGVEGFLGAANVDNASGSLVVNGFDISGVGPGSDLDFLEIHFSSTNKEGTTQITVDVNSLTTPEAVSFSSVTSSGASIEVKTETTLTGCPDRPNKVISNHTYQELEVVECVGSQSITAGNGVTVRNGANVKFVAPIVTLSEGFVVEDGGVFWAGSGS